MYNDPSKSSRFADSTQLDHPANPRITVDPRHVDVCAPRPLAQLSSQPSASVLSGAVPRVLHWTPARRKTEPRRRRVSHSARANEADAAQLLGPRHADSLQLRPLRHPTSTADQSRRHRGRRGHRRAPPYGNAGQK